MSDGNNSLNIFDRILLLKHSQVFSDVSNESLRNVAQHLLEETYKKGERVFDINEHGEYMYFIAKGKIGISIDPDPSVAKFVAELDEGQCFGEMGILDDTPRSATAHVVEESVLLVLEKTRLLSLISSHPELALGMLRSLSARLRETNQKMVDAANIRPEN
ncbi:MAG: cyclic nucleotide-binding domain-containing protein [Gammaproteobacteria bacterium]|nr:cyclic nucleotide-binding domain-containing protein [Gammaproteobacteria bacterium]MDH5694938.1 cyclic nucleotide-binding domain-containing protein [Gammaproteobacteria bacterium]